MAKTKSTPKKAKSILRVTIGSRTPCFINDVQGDTTFLEIKQKIQHQTKIPVAEQQLFLRNEPIDDNATYDSCGFSVYGGWIELIPFRTWTDHKLELQQFDNICESIESRFCCGGFIDNPARIFFLMNGTDHHVSFPNCSKEDLELLKNACTPSKFGKGQQKVLDPSYRNALSLFPPDFAISIHPSEFDILTKIQQLMVPNVKAVRAELYQLNVYGEGSHFKSHVDTPRGADMIGSLVISLPCAHEGGQLLVRKGSKEHTFDFSTQDSSSSKIQWAAFFADCEHEILEITKGCRITVTYLLKSIPNDDIITSCVEASHPEVIQKLQTLLSDVSFFPEGKTLVFGCVHSYANDALNQAQKNPSSVLKGADAVLYSCLKAAGMAVSVNGIFELTGYTDDGESRDYYWIANNMPASVKTGSIYEDSSVAEFVKQTFPEATKWLAAVTSSYGNDISSDSLYVEGVLLVNLPPGTSLARQWRILRTLWIGKLKNEASTCHLAKCPKEVLQLIIAKYLGKSGPVVQTAVKRKNNQSGSTKPKKKKK